MNEIIKCPYCGSENVKDSGGYAYNKNGNKKRYRCLNPECKVKRFTLKDGVEVSEGKFDKLIRLLKVGLCSIEELSNKTGLLPAEIREKIKELENEKYNINYIDNKIELAKSIEIGNKQKLNIDYWKGDRLKIGFCSDNQLCSKFERLDVLNLIYDIFADEGIELVYHGGNLIDGECRFNKYEIHTSGMTPQVEYCINNYPERKGIITKFITADDHEGWYVQRERINIGEYIQLKAEQLGRNDLEYIGHVEADIPFEGIKGESWMRIMHPGGGTAYALSYTPQKIVESFQGGDKPKILLLGHYHKLDYCFPREVHCIQIGCTCDQTIWMRKKHIQAHVGGGILEIILAPDGTINRVRVEFITFFNKSFYKGNNKYWK